MFVPWVKIWYISQLDAIEKNVWLLQLNIADSKKNYKKIYVGRHFITHIELKTTYFHESTALRKYDVLSREYYGDCNQSLTKSRNKMET